MADEKPVITKVKAYPMPATLDLNGVKKPAEVLYLTTLGAMVRLPHQMVFVGEYYQLYFELPVVNEDVNTQVRIIKTYDRSVNPKEALVERVAELHFQNLSQEHRARIASFTSAIRQEL